MASQNKTVTKRCSLNKTGVPVA